MFSLLCGAWEHFTRKREYNVVIIGLDAAGKTTLLEQIKALYLNQQGLRPDQIVPTVGLNIARVPVKGATLVCWDLGGQEGLRSIWDKYYTDAHGVIFVVDAADAERLADARETLARVTQHRAFYAAPVLILANKQDLSDAMRPAQLTEYFAQTLREASPSKPRRLSAVAALQGGSGVADAIEWLMDAMIRLIPTPNA